MPTQPTILVKKKDGASVRMTMDEFRVYVRTTKGVRNYESTNNKTPATEPQTPITEHQTTKPVASVRTPNPDNRTPPKKSWTKDDHKSPLEVGEVKEARKQEVVKTVLPESRGDAFDGVIRNLKFPVADELRPRLKSLIVSRVKDIRTDEQVVEYATRAVENGGLGLTEAQAGELVGAIGTSALQHRSTSAPEHQSTGVPRQAIRIPNSDNRTPTPTFHIPHSTFPEHRPVMHDVIAPKEEAKASVGPVEELQQLTLTDFRRLSANPAQAGEILFGKFDGLKNESYVLFIKAVQAWYNSPLYKQYQQIIADAINRTVKIKDAFGQMKDEEYKAIVKLCNSL